MSNCAKTATVAVHLERNPLAARTARKALLHLLGDGPSIAFVRDAVLLTSELVSNALMHTSGELDVEVTYHTPPDRLRVEVRDESPVLPALVDEPLGPTRHGGLGMRLVEDVASSWGACPRPGGGKTVWFEMAAS